MAVPGSLAFLTTVFLMTAAGIGFSTPRQRRPDHKSLRKQPPTFSRPADYFPSGAGSWWVYENRRTHDALPLMMRVKRVETTPELREAGNDAAGAFHIYFELGRSRSPAGPLSSDSLLYRLCDRDLVQEMTGDAGADSFLWQSIGPLLHKEMKPGEHWDGTGSVRLQGVVYNGTARITVSGPELQQVPAGTFRAFKIHEAESLTGPEQETMGLSFDVWFAAGVGIIRKRDTTDYHRHRDDFVLKSWRLNASSRKSPELK